LEEKDLAVAQIVSAIISKENVYVGADNKEGINIHIPGAREIKHDYRGTLKLEDLIKLVKESM